MEDTPNVTISQESYDNLINASAALVNQLRQKEADKTAVITPEEAEFANAFFSYSKEMIEAVKGRYGDDIKAAEKRKVSAVEYAEMYSVPLANLTDMKRRLEVDLIDHEYRLSRLDSKRIETEIERDRTAARIAELETEIERRGGRG
ncbi:hypothetical protein P4T38_10750 [Bacillus safensis]|uniref:hypothetical protein n=1 Tax=Bacillus safensis TaxID=561879 RepID=UPI00227EAAF5|nr:hypothetical protein [Bacillus safensis]MCY7711268.1 hypothetical protein [Bacillus safensis]MCY7727253.1 hypothetical protein [Bacillus safensis]MED0883193.1 hypothetical protein [Bacillus safensis]MED0918479.1 hypothetical protein [Bacillus safensis]